MINKEHDKLNSLVSLSESSEYAFFKELLNFKWVHLFSGNIYVTLKSGLVFVNV